MKRSGKFYRKNEKEVMESLGLKATYNSGSGWIEKEDGQNIKLSDLNEKDIEQWKKDMEVRALSEYYKKRIKIK